MSRLGLWARCPQIKSRRAKFLRDAGVATNRAFHKTAAALRNKIVLRPKPALKDVLLRTGQIQNFHGAIMQRTLCQWQTATPSPKRR